MLIVDCVLLVHELLSVKNLNNENVHNIWTEVAVTLGSSQPLTEMSTRHLPCGG